MANALDGYNPAPLDQGVLTRVTRGTAGAAIGGSKGVFAGFLATPLVGIAVGIGLAVGVPLAGALLLGAFGAFGGVAAATTSLIATAGPALAATGAILGLIGGAIAAPFGGVVGGLYGGFKGASNENQRAGVDQSFHDVVMAEAMARGHAQGQALAYTNPQPPAYMPQPAAGQQDAVMARTDTKRDAVMPTMNQADSVVQADTVESKGVAPATKSMNVAMDRAALADAAKHGQVAAAAL